MRLLALLLVCFAAVAAEAQTEPERILLPISGLGAPGAYGTRWTVTTWYRNDGDIPRAVLPVSFTDWVPSPKFTVELPLFVPPPGAPPGQFIYLQAGTSIVQITSRVREITHQTIGLDIPGIRESSFSRSTIGFIAVPIESSSRAMLRIYEADASGSDTARIQIFRSSDDQLLESREVVLTRDGLPRYSPGYAQVPVSSDLADLVRVTVDGPEGKAFWAFITITDNVTQQVTAMFPH